MTLPLEETQPRWPLFSQNLGNDSQICLGACLVWFHHYHGAFKLSTFPGNRVGWRICHLSWHLKDKNGIINRASSSERKKKRSPAGMSKWRTLACSFSTRLPAAEVSLLITWCHLSSNVLPNLSSRPAAPNNAGKIYDSQNISAESKIWPLNPPPLRLI